MSSCRDTKDKFSAYMREYRKKNPLTMKQIDLKKRFGITLEDFNSMMESQSGVCKICKSPELTIDHRTKTVRNLAVDHCHTTGKIRGLLCTNCNRALGLFKDSPELLQAALLHISLNA